MFENFERDIMTKVAEKLEKLAMSPSLALDAAKTILPKASKTIKGGDSMKLIMDRIGGALGADNRLKQTISMTGRKPMPDYVQHLSDTMSTGSKDVAKLRGGISS